MTKQRRVVLVVALVLGGLMLLGVIALVTTLILIRPILREKLVEEAQKRGYELGFDEIELGFGSVGIEGARFRLVGVRSMGGTAKRIDISLSGLSPSAVRLEDLQLNVLGSLPAVALEVTEWTKNFPGSYQLALSARPVAVNWLAQEGGQPVLQVSGAEVSHTEAGGSFRAPQAVVAGLSLSPVDASFTKGQGSIVLGFGGQKPEEAAVSIQVNHAGPTPSATITLRPTPIEQLALTFGVPAPIQGVTIGATSQLTLPGALQRGPVKGTLDVALKGYVPPHPPELNGIVFGDTTEFKTAFEISKDQKVATLTDTQVSAGAFKLNGDGDVHRYADSSRVRLRLAGNLSCGALAGAAAQNALGGAIGQLAAGLARQTVGGAVGVRVNIDADTRALQDAKVVRTIGIGCGLKPGTLPDPKELEAFTRELPRFAGELPGIPLLQGLPSALPQLPPLPSFRIAPPGSAE